MQLRFLLTCVSICSGSHNAYPRPAFGFMTTNKTILFVVRPQGEIFSPWRLHLTLFMSSVSHYFSGWPMVSSSFYCSRTIG
nr:MAG TPA: hypothetical protein [Caudoviricetes sp.]